MNTHKLAFTLIEIMIVVAIIGILAGVIIVVINPDKQRGRARDAIRREDIAIISGAFERYYADNNSYPTPLPTVGSQLTGSNSIVYLQEMPGDPNTGSSYTCLQADNAYGQTCKGGQSFRICATLESPEDPTNDQFCLSNAF